MSVTASHLSTILQGSNGNSSQLSRHVSSVGEHFSNSYTTPPVPKRAETFAGFDSQFDVPKGKYYRASGIWSNPTYIYDWLISQVKYNQRGRTLFCKSLSSTCICMKLNSIKKTEGLFLWNNGCYK